MRHDLTRLLWLSALHFGCTSERPKLSSMITSLPSDASMVASPDAESAEASETEDSGAEGTSSTKQEPSSTAGHGSSSVGEGRGTSDTRLDGGDPDDGSVVDCEVTTRCLDSFSVERCDCSGTCVSEECDGACVEQDGIEGCQGECRPEAVQRCGSCGEQVCGESYEWLDCVGVDPPTCSGTKALVQCTADGTHEESICAYVCETSETDGGHCGGECDPADVETCGDCATRTCTALGYWGDCQPLPESKSSCVDATAISYCSTAGEWEQRDCESVCDVDAGACAGQCPPGDTRDCGDCGQQLCDDTGQWSTCGPKNTAPECINSGATVRTCGTSGQFVNTDCPANRECSAGACLKVNAEQCNGPDECLAGDCRTYYLDADQDGYGDASSPQGFCVAPPAGGHYVTNATDCCDAEKDAHPGATGWHSTAMGCGGSYDWDCNGTAEVRYPALACDCFPSADDCIVGACPASQPAPAFFERDVPCGQGATLYTGCTTPNVMYPWCIGSADIGTSVQDCR